MANDATIGVGIKGDASHLKKEVGGLGASVSSAFSGMKGMIAGAFSIGAITAFARSTLETVSNIKHLADAAQISTDEFQALSYVARRAGADEEMLSRAIAKVATAQVEALGGNDKMTAAFARLGITHKDLIKYNPAEVFEMMAKALRDSAQSGAPLLSTMEIIGEKMAPKLLVTLDEIAKTGLKGLRDDAVASGELIDKNVIAKVHELDELQTGMWRKAKAMLAEGIVGIGEWMGNIITPPSDDSERKQREAIRAQNSVMPGQGDIGAPTPEQLANRKKLMKNPYAESSLKSTPAAETQEQAAKRKLKEATDAEEAAKKKEKARAAAERFSDQKWLQDQEAADKTSRAQDKISDNYNKQSAKIATGEGISVGALQVNAWQRIGATTGGTVRPEMRQAEKQLAIQEKQKALLEEVKMQLLQINEKLDED